MTLYIPNEIADAMRALPLEVRKKLSLHNIDVLTRPFRDRIRELEAELECHEHEIDGQRMRADKAEQEKVSAIGLYGLEMIRADKAEAYIRELESTLHRLQKDALPDPHDERDVSVDWLRERINQACRRMEGK